MHTGVTGLTRLAKKKKKTSPDVCVCLYMYMHVCFGVLDI